MAKVKKPKTGKPLRKKARGALTAIGGLLIASAVIRVATGAGEAFAREGGAEDAVATPIEAAALAAPGVERITEEEFVPLLKALDAREERVKKREKAIEVRMQALSVAEEEIDRKLIALQEAEEALSATLAVAKTAAEDDLTRLTDVYANMKPKQAAALFEEMDPEFAAGFLGRMRSNSAAAIMAGLSPRAAYTISVILAGRNASVPTE